VDEVTTELNELIERRVVGVRNLHIVTCTNEEFPEVVAILHQGMAFIIFPTPLLGHLSLEVRAYADNGKFQDSLGMSLQVPQFGERSFTTYDTVSEDDLKGEP
jgi:hypothetical protein